MEEKASGGFRSEYHADVADTERFVHLECDPEGLTANQHLCIELLNCESPLVARGQRKGNLARGNCLHLAGHRRKQLTRFQATRRVRKIAVKRLLASSCLPVRPSVRREQLGSHWTGFHEI